VFEGGLESYAALGFPSGLEEGDSACNQGVPSGLNFTKTPSWSGAVSEKTGEERGGTTVTEKKRKASGCGEQEFVFGTALGRKVVKGSKVAREKQSGASIWKKRLRMTAEKRRGPEEKNSEDKTDCTRAHWQHKVLRGPDTSPNSDKKKKSKLRNDHSLLEDKRVESTCTHMRTKKRRG